MTNHTIIQAIDALPALRDVVNDFGLRADKAFGQNFLFDLNLTGKIARSANDLTDATIIEVGPGPGGLTRALLTQTGAKQIIAIEKDRRVIPALQPLVEAAQGTLTLIEGDALHFDYDAIPAPKAIIANLPYNVATPLLLHWLHHADQFVSFTLMFQREVADRLFAPVGDKAYGRLSIITQYMCDGYKIFDLPPEAFTPPPKVTSSVVRLKPKAMPLYSDQKPIADMLSTLEHITQLAFGQRRKMLRQSWKSLSIAWDVVGIAETERAEDISVADYARVALYLLNRQ
jgi:16S rRNA (adenine1518-N6/adenine1519-N6)-dimethyltransferase